jgi:hypothetical protein
VTGTSSTEAGVGALRGSGITSTMMPSSTARHGPFHGKLCRDTAVVTEQRPRPGPQRRAGRACCHRRDRILVTTGVVDRASVIGPVTLTCADGPAVRTLPVAVTETVSR